jgi:hypothetical protein
VIRFLVAHAEHEAGALAAYEQLAEESPDDAVRYLARLLLEDERRHHEQLGEMINSFRSFTEDVDIKPRIPEVSGRHDATVRESTRRLLSLEKEDAKELRRLRKELKRGPSSPLMPLLVSLMVHDTAKHIEILQLIRDRVA